MSVKRYTIYYNERERDMYVAESQDGKYCLHSDYAALLARHNALREAVAKYLGVSDTAAMAATEDALTMDMLSNTVTARDEVDRLMEEKYLI